MSTTLNSLYAHLLAELGTLNNMEDFHKPELLEKRQEWILQSMELFAQARYLDAWEHLVDHFDKTNLSIEGDPVPSLLQARAVDEAIRQGEKNPWLMMYMDYARNVAWGGIYLRMMGMRNEFNKSCPTANTEGLLRMRDTLRYLQQYALFRDIGVDLYKKRDCSKQLSWWEEQKFHRFNNYTHVHPFALALCPPSHIWSKYIADAEVHEVFPEGLKQTPIDDYDFASVKDLKPNPFLHIPKPDVATDDTSLREWKMKLHQRYDSR